MPNPSPQPVVLPPDAAEVTRLLARGNSRSAVEAAKTLHKRVGTAATETLLVEAYAARAQSMREHKLAAEADALLAMVREKFPRSASLLAALATASASGATLDDLVRPLADPAGSPEARAAAEHGLRTALTDPADLANCAALPPDHPLRVGATAIVRALGAVTSGPVEDTALALPEISHRGPLGAWKPLLRAIACFYRGEDEACARNLAAIDPAAAPARLVPALRDMLTGDGGKKLNYAAGELVSRAAGDLAPLRDALRDLESQFEDGSKNATLNAIRRTMSLAQKECPAVVNELRSQIGVRTMVLDLPPSAVNSALGGKPSEGAHSALLYARILETDPERPLEACFAWEVFRELAVREGWFPPSGPEVATVYLHMAEIVAGIPEEELNATYASAQEMLRREASEEGYLPEAGMPFIHASWLYETACRMDPHPAAFEKWIEWAENGPGERDAEEAAEAWHRAMPRDPRPLVRLMNYSEGRGALKKALQYLDQAEKLDGLNPEVRHARLRLLVREAIRHVKGRKLRQAFKSVAALRCLPQSREKDRPALVDGIEHAAHLVDRNPEAMLAVARRMEERLGSEGASNLARTAIATLCGVQAGIRLADVQGRGGDWIESIARVGMMGHDLDFTFGPPADWRPEILQALPGSTASAAALEEIGRIALRMNWSDVAFAASAAGLAKYPGAEARFLLLRAQALPESYDDRAEQCVLAALELARRERDLATVNKAVELWQSISFGGLLGDDVHLDEKRLKKILDRERKERKLPRARREDSLFSRLPDFDFDFDFDFTAPRKRRRRSRRAAPEITDRDVPF